MKPLTVQFSPVYTYCILNPNVLFGFLQVFRPKFWRSYKILICPTQTTCPARLILIDFISLLVFNEDYRLWNSSFCSFSNVLSNLNPFTLGWNILVYCPFLNHSQNFQCKRLRFTPTQNCNKYYVVLIFTFEYRNQSCSVLLCMGVKRGLLLFE
jgi:hypothetical protein